MFGRRTSLPLLSRIAAFVWPRGGWRRQSTYVAHRLKRLPGTPNRIAAGFASGVAVSFTPFIGFHFILAVCLSALLRGNFIASAVGTAAGNPWTFPFIWIATYKLGHWILGSSNGRRLPNDVGISYLFDHPMDVLWPMAIGGFLLGTLAWFVAFFPIRSLVMKYQFQRRKRLLVKARRKRVKMLSDRAVAAPPADSELLPDREVS